MYKRKRRWPRTKPWGSPPTTVLLEETWPLPRSTRENPGNEIVDFFDAAVILKYKALSAVQGAKQKQIWRGTGHTRERLKTWTFRQLRRYLRDRQVAVSADGRRKVQLVDKVSYESLLALEVLPNENQLIENIAQRRNLALHQQKECKFGKTRPAACYYTRACWWDKSRLPIC